MSYANEGQSPDGATPDRTNGRLTRPACTFGTAHPSQSDEENLSGGFALRLSSRCCSGWAIRLGDSR
mgnify:CR=1 FL=1